MSVLNNITRHFNCSYRISYFIKFCIVGGICTIMDFIVYWCMLIITPYQNAMIIGYMTSLIINYILTTKWTFKENLDLFNFIGVIFIHLINCFVIRNLLLTSFIEYAQRNEKEAYIYTINISAFLNYIFLSIFFHYSRVRKNKQN